MPVPCEPRSTGLPDRMARRTSARRRWPRPMPCRRGSPDTPSPRGWRSSDCGPCASPARRSSVAYWRRPASGSHRQQNLRHQPDRPRCTPRRPVLEYPTENIPLTEALVAGTRERRMIRDSILEADLAEPAIGKVHLHFTTDQPLRTNRKDIPHDEHPDHQFRIDRRTAHGRIMGCKFAAKPGQIETVIDLPHQMIFRNRVAKMKLVEQLRLVTLQPAHHALPSPRFVSTQRNHGSPPISTDFCNKIGTF